jgi:hypothetical protein
MVKNLSKSIWVEAIRELKFFRKNVKKKSKSVWVEAGELKFCMNMLFYFKLKTAYSDLEFLEVHLRNF